MKVILYFHILTGLKHYNSETRYIPLKKIFSDYISSANYDNYHAKNNN